MKTYVFSILALLLFFHPWAMSVQVLDSGPEDIFMVGEKAFWSVALDKKVSREDWYRVMLRQQDERLKTDMLKCFGVTVKQAEVYLQVMQKSMNNYEQKSKKAESSIVGTWYVDTKLNCYKTKKAGCTACNITKIQMDFLKQKLKDCGFSGSILMSQPSGDVVAAAGYNAIYIKPLLFYQGEVDKLFALHHELTHIRNQDAAWTALFEELIFEAQKGKGFFLTSKQAAMSAPKKAKKLLKKWKVFLERRADLEGFFALRKESSFQAQTKKQANFQGYSFQFISFSGYVYQAKVNYIKDFLDGIKNDYKLHLTILKLAAFA